MFLQSFSLKRNSHYQRSRIIFCLSFLFLSDFLFCFLNFVFFLGPPLSPPGRPSPLSVGPPSPWALSCSGAPSLPGKGKKEKNKFKRQRKERGEKKVANPIFPLVVCSPSPEGPLKGAGAKGRNKETSAKERAPRGAKGAAKEKE